VPFFQAGDDLLRSKSLDRNSYNSGDWFNAIDWTGQTTNWGHGLPLAGDNEGMWPIMAPLLANPDLMPQPEDIAAARAHFQEMAQVRASSPLFRLPTAEAVQARLQFLNTGPQQIPGVIVMGLSDVGGGNLSDNLDPAADRVRRSGPGGRWPCTRCWLTRPTPWCVSRPGTRIRARSACPAGRRPSSCSPKAASQPRPYRRPVEPTAEATTAPVVAPTATAQVIGVAPLDTQEAPEATIAATPAAAPTPEPTDNRASVTAVALLVIAASAGIVAGLAVWLKSRREGM